MCIIQTNTHVPKQYEPNKHGHLSYIQMIQREYIKSAVCYRCSFLRILTINQTSEKLKIA